MKAMLLLLPMFFISCGESGGGSNSGVEGSGFSVSDETKSELLELVNTHRMNLGLKKLIVGNPLKSEIQVHTNNMASATTPFGHSGMSFRCTKAKSAMGGGNLCGEVVAESSKGASAQDVFSQWMNSLGHRAKIEEARYNRVGIGMSLDKDKDLYSGMLLLEY